MNRKLKHISLSTFGILLTNTTFCFSQDSIQKDTSNIKVIYFKEAIKERYKGDDFNYSINDTGGINLIQRVLQKLFGWLSDIFGFDIDFIDYKTLEYTVSDTIVIETINVMYR